jgi:hypothetical protein
MLPVKFGVGMKEVSSIDAQIALQKTITWIKIFGKRKIEWQKACHEIGM